MIETIITQNEIQAIEDGRQVGKIEFSLVGNELSIFHTYAYEKGKGIGTLLMKSAMEWAETNRYTINPVCSFVAKHLQNQ